jgi:hypothetical protein
MKLRTGFNGDRGQYPDFRDHLMAYEHGQGRLHLLMEKEPEIAVRGLKGVARARFELRCWSFHRVCTSHACAKGKPEANFAEYDSDEEYSVS